MTSRITSIVLSLALVLAIGGCGGTDSQEAEPVTTTVVIDEAPPRDDCQAAVYEAVDLVVQLVEFVDNQRLSDLQETRLDEDLERIGASIDELHARFGDSCAGQGHEEAFTQSVAGLEAETEAGRAVLDMFRGES